MTKSVLNTKPLPKVKETVEFNTVNGNDAELLAASRFVMGCGAEISWGSRNEDGRKIDLIVSYDHPWIEQERVLVLVQVKSGPTYGILNGEGFILKTAAKSAAQRTSHSICLIWLERKKNKTFWAYIHPNSLSGNQEYGKNHLISPATRFDIARCQVKTIPIKSGGAGVIMSQSQGDLKTQRLNALKKYKDLKTKNLICPNLGLIEFSALGWRHMFRKGRTADRKATSLTVIEYLDKIIVDKPNDIYISKCEMFEELKYTYRKSEYVLAYDDIEISEAKKVSKVKVVCRVIEEIRWPTDWINIATLSQHVDRRLVFLSCYYKK